MQKQPERYKATPRLTGSVVLIAILMSAIISIANPDDFEYFRLPFAKLFISGIAAGYLISPLLVSGGLLRRLNVGFMLASVALGPAVMAAGFILTARMDFDAEIGVNMAFMGPFFLSLPFFIGFLCLKPLKRLPEYGRLYWPYVPSPPDDPPTR